ncbi:MAG: formyltetrahydrofolate deformylase [Acidobacteria bacterium]|nr:MAG: formyltetrahydrofolate deformylase [Acidobacteriota bacterium]
MQPATLLISCPDRKGIVAALAQLLYGLGANILDSDQHTDVEAGQFFQRIRFDRAEMRVDEAGLRGAVAEVAGRFAMHWRLENDERRKRIAIFVSKVDHCLWDLLLRQRSGELRCEIAFLVSNHETLRPIAEQFEIPYHHLPITADSRARQEARQAELIGDAGVELVVLARYMQILSEELVSRFPNRILNIHHSFLPAFLGGNPYRQAYGRGVKLIGATAHYATSDLDEGPIVEQDVVRCSHRDSVRDLVRKGRDLERVVLGRAVRWHLEDRVLVYGNKTVVFA